MRELRKLRRLVPLLVRRLVRRPVSEPWRSAAAVLVASFIAVAGCGERSGAPPSDALVDALTSHVTIADRADVYAVLAFVNAAGYDDESAPEMRAERKLVRGAAPRLLSDAMFERVDSSYRAHAGAGVSGYLRAALGDSSGPVSPAAFAPLLAAFAREMRVDSLHELQRATHEAYVGDLRASLREQTAAFVEYHHLTDTATASVAASAKRVVVVPGLLLSHDRSHSVMRGDTLFFVVGTQSVVAFDPAPLAHLISPLPHDAAERDSLLSALTTALRSRGPRRGA